MDIETLARLASERPRTATETAGVELARGPWRREGPHSHAFDVVLHEGRPIGLVQRTTEGGGRALTLSTQDRGVIGRDLEWLLREAGIPSPTRGDVS